MSTYMIDPIHPASRSRRFRSSWSAAGVSCVFFASTLLGIAQTVAPAAPALSPQPREIQPGACNLRPASTSSFPAAMRTTSSPHRTSPNPSPKPASASPPQRAPPTSPSPLLRADSPPPVSSSPQPISPSDAPMHDEGYILLSHKNTTPRDRRHHRPNLGRHLLRRANPQAINRALLHHPAESGLPPSATGLP